MSVKIRLTRVGARNDPSYRVVVIDSRKRRDGKYIEKLGYYDPKPKEFKYEIDEKRAIFWMKQGAIPSETVKSLFKRAGILSKIHNMKFGSNEPKVEKKVSEQMEVNEELNEKESAEKPAQKITAGGDK
ncbi:MAG: 30S ribosomal protein S16 [Candidatus Cloacimonetes bacterium]|nr:30S ribosomal protein S16 [Candidatus Cloacimonadota bacterium]MBL7108218.1 30S ribosomal protein S16 [Candidatus Cloacimonadota bacterium]